MMYNVIKYKYVKSSVIVDGAFLFGNNRAFPIRYRLRCLVHVCHSLTSHCGDSSGRFLVDTEQTGGDHFV